MQGTVAKLARNALPVQLEGGHTIRATLSGRMQQKHIRLSAVIRGGTNVSIEMTPYDLSKERIVFRPR